MDKADFVLLDIVCVCALLMFYEQGNWFSPSGFGLADKTVKRMWSKVSRLYEQGATEQRIETYLTHWWRWVRSGVQDVVNADVGVWFGLLCWGLPCLSLPLLVSPQCAFAFIAGADSTMPLS